MKGFQDDLVPPHAKAKLLLQEQAKERQEESDASSSHSSKGSEGRDVGEANNTPATGDPQRPGKGQPTEGQQQLPGNMDPANITI